MVPVFNSRPYHSSQVQTNGTTATDTQQQVMPSNQFQGNPSNLLPQIQSQMGIINPQIPIPFNNSNTHLGNGNNSFMNVANQPFPLQNGMSPLGQFPSGYGPQNLNTMAMNQFNLSQLSQLFPRNSMNLAPYFNQNISLPNGQFCMQGPMQNLGQFVQMQMPNHTLQVSQGRGPHNPAFIVNQQGMMHFNGVAPHGNQEQKLPNTTQQLQGSSSLQPAFGSVQLPQPQNFRPPIFTNQQGNPRKDNAISNMSTNGKNSQSRNFTRHPKHKASQGFTKPQAHMQNAKGKFKFHNERGGKGYKNEGARKSVLANPGNQTQPEKKKSLSLHYTEQEIQQWRDARKKNFPSKTNLEKKLTKKMAEPELTDKDVELRRQQLKEVLAKQAELGCEVAEIPSHYLSDSEKQVHGQEENKRAFNKKGRSRNKFNKRGRRYENDRFAKKQRPSDTNSAILNDQTNVFNQTQRMRNNDPSTGPITKKREPTLLQKLLSADLRRDRGHLLQVFRFMVMNSFFKDQPEKPLIFPVVTVKEAEREGEGELVEEKSYLMAGVCFEGEKTIARNCNDNGDNENDFTEAQANETGNVAKEEGSIGKAIKVVEEEEGEIFD